MRNGLMLRCLSDSISTVPPNARKAMGRALQQVKMPCREDVIGLAERLTPIEMAMVNLDAKLDLALEHRSAAPTPRKAPLLGRVLRGGYG